MKKIISSVLVIVLLFNFIFCNNCTYVFADDEDTAEQNTPYTEGTNTSTTISAEIINEGTVEQGDLGTAIIGTLLGIVARIINIIIVQIDVLMSSITVAEETVNGTAQTEFWYTIDRTVFNRIPLFNINYFNTDATYEVGDIEITADPNNLKIKEGITSVYYICRLLAMIILLLVLIYIGIRMALSTVASEQAKYKKMLVSWIESVVIMFFLVYIASAIIYFGESITGIFYNMRCDLINSDQGYDVFENTIRDNAWSGVFGKAGLDLALWSIIYWILLFTELKFFWLYAKRLLMVGLLLTISPLITITYSIDKVGDGKAQVFSAWVKEFLVNVLIQPLHALIYLIFVLTANTIAQKSPLVAVAMFLAMGSVERMVKVVFDMKGMSTLRGINKFMKKEG